MQIFGTDFDGVIINIEPEKAVVFAELVNRKWKADKNEAAKFWREFLGTSRRHKFDHFYEKMFGKKLDEQTYQLIRAEYGNYLKTNFYPKVKFLPGALEILKLARENFDFTFVSSGMPLDEINYLIQLLGLTEYFDVVLGTDNVYKSKNEHFAELLKDKHPDLFVFLADGAKDMEVAKKFGAKAIAVLTNRPKKELVKAGADFICQTPLEAIPILQKML